MGVAESQIHLLGVWHLLDDALDVVQEFPNLMGLDTTLPFAHAVSDLYTHETLEKTNIPEALWTAPFVEEEHREVTWRAETNIAYVRQRLLEAQERNVTTALSRALRQLQVKAQPPTRLLR